MAPLSVLPLITPPFVLGLAMLYLFGRRGFVTHRLLRLSTDVFFGPLGVAVAQVLAYTPIAYLVLVGVVRAMDASLEEAAQTLGAPPASPPADRHLAAGPAGPGQRLPPRGHREPGGLRQPHRGRRRQALPGHRGVLRHRGPLQPPRGRHLRRGPAGPHPRPSSPCSSRWVGAASRTSPSQGGLRARRPQSSASAGWTGPASGLFRPVDARWWRSCTARCSWGP
jgi:hypothetical protein